MSKYDRGDVATVIGRIWGDNTRVVAEAMNINANILKEVLDRLEKLEAPTKEQTAETRARS